MFRREVKTTVYVPIGDNDRRSYAEKWSDIEYLRQIVSFSGNHVYNTELAVALERMRAISDAAETPEELKGCRSCIGVLKELIVSPARAMNRIRAINESSEIEQEIVQ